MQTLLQQMLDKAIEILDTFCDVPTWIPIWTLMKNPQGQTN